MAAILSRGRWVKFILMKDKICYTGMIITLCSDIKVTQEAGGPIQYKDVVLPV